jgi:integrase
MQITFEEDSLPNADITFHEQAEKWLVDLATRKRKPISPATLRAFGSYVRRLTPMIGRMPLAEISNGVAKQVVTKMCDQGLSSKTVNEILATLKSVVGSAIDPATGEQLFPITWNSKYIDAPIVGSQYQPCLTRQELEECIRNAASEQERLFYCVLAGTGLRVSEALAIRVAGGQDQTSWDQESSSIRVRSSVYKGKEQSRLKTPSARRTADLDPQLNGLIAQFVAANKIPPGAFLFQARTGRSMHLVTATARLAKHGERAKGFHAFRRFRITHLREFGVREEIIRFWVGHSAKGITDKYSKLAENAELRKQWASKCRLGFDLPEFCKPGHPAPSSFKTPKPAAAAKADSIVEAVPELVRYQASNDDLPAELFETPAEHAERA